MYNKWTSLSNCNERIRSREWFNVMMDGSRTWRGGHHNDMNTHKWIVLNVDPAAVRAIAETGLRGTWPLPHFPSACISPRNLLQYILYRSDHIWGPSACSRCDAMRCDVIHNSQVNFLFILLWNAKLWLEKILTTTFYGDSFCYSTRWFFVRFYLRFIQSTRDEVVLDQFSI